MTDIASNLDKVIEKLDGMTSEVVAKNYGMDIASKVDHIAKQLDYVQAGGGSSAILFNNAYMTFNAGTMNVTSEKTFAEIKQAYEDECFVVIVVHPPTTWNKPDLNLFLYSIEDDIMIFSNMLIEIIENKDCITHTTLQFNSDDTIDYSNRSIPLE